jgi:hypothetical protein
MTSAKTYSHRSVRLDSLRRTRYESYRCRRSNIAAGKLLRFRRIGVVRSLDRILPVQETKLSHQIPHANAHAPNEHLEKEEHFPLQPASILHHRQNC